MRRFYFSSLLAHLLLTFDWLAVSLGLWGYPNVSNRETRSIGGQSLLSKAIDKA